MITIKNNDTVASFTPGLIKQNKGTLALFVVAAAVAALFTMATALSVTDFLQLIFPTENGVTSFVAPNANPVLRLLQRLYVLLAAQGPQRALVLYALLLLLIYGMKNLFSYTAVVTFAKFKISIMASLRNLVHRSVLRQDFAGWSAQQQGQWLAVMSSDMAEYETNVLDALSLLLQALLTMVIYLLMLLYLDWKLTLVVVIVMAVGTFLLSASRRLKRQSRNLQDLNGHLISTIQETLDSLKEIKAATAIEFVNRRQREQNAVFSRRRVAVYRLIDAASPLSDFLGNTIVVAILIIGAFRVLGDAASMSPSMFISYVMIYVLLLTPIKDFSNAIAQFKKGRGVEERISERLVSSDEPQHVESPAPGTIESIALSDVTFAYGSQEVLAHFSHRLTMHRHTAVVGPSGSGKTTFGRIVVGLLQPQKGQVLINGAPTTAVQRRGRIAYIPQDPMLFNDTVEGNIRFGRPWVSDEQIEAAIRMAQVQPIVDNLPQGLQTPIGDGGSRLSGGERQRVSIARALVGNPDIVVMDEATAALDAETEQHFIQSLQEAMESRTLIVIAHRASTIARCHTRLAINAPKATNNI